MMTTVGFEPTLFRTSIRYVTGEPETGAITARPSCPLTELVWLSVSN
jgi:hypothetical protein